MAILTGATQTKVTFFGRNGHTISPKVISISAKVETISAKIKKKREMQKNFIEQRIRVIKTFHNFTTTHYGIVLEIHKIILIFIRFMFNEGLALLIIDVRLCSVIIVLGIQSKYFV